MRNRFFPGSLCLIALALGFLAVGGLAQEKTEPAKVRDELTSSEQQISRQFDDFVQSLLKLKQRLERSEKPADRERAKVLAKVLEETRNTNIALGLERLTSFLKTGKLNNLDEVGRAEKESHTIAANLNRLLALLREDPRQKQQQDKAKLIAAALKNLEDIINKEKNLEYRTRNGKSDPKELEANQKQLGERTAKLAKDIDRIKGDKGDGKTGDEKDLKGENKSAGKGDGKPGESKDIGKSADPKAGEAKDAGKQGEATAKAEAKSAPPGEPKEAKGNEGQAKAGGEPKESGAKGSKEGTPSEPKEAKVGPPENKGGDAKGSTGEQAKGEPKAGAPKSGAPKSGDPKASDKGSPAEAKAGPPESKKGGDAKGSKGEQAKGEPKAGAPKSGAPKSGAPKSGDPKASDKGSPAEAKAGPPESKKGGDAKGSKGEQAKGEPKAGEGKGGDSKPGEAKSGSESKGQASAKSDGQPPPGQTPPSPGSQAQAKDGGQPPPSGQQPPPPGAPKDDLAQSKKRIQEGGYDMHKAEKELGKKNNPEAAQHEKDAVAKLEAAKAELEKLLRQLREEETERVIAALKARCEKMLVMQQQVLAGTLGVHRAIDATADKQPKHEHKQDSIKLSDREKEIVAEATIAIEILEAEGSAVAFPEVFHQVREDMKHVQRRLELTDVAAVTQAIENDIIDSLKEMIEALKKAQQEMDNKKNNPSPPSGSPPPTDQKLLDQIAELKMIRSLQIRVNTRTTTYGRQYEGEQAIAPNIRQEIQNLSERQERIFDITRRIAKGDNR